MVTPKEKNKGPKYCPNCSLLFHKMEEAREYGDSMRSIVLFIVVLGLGLAYITYQVGCCVGR